MRKLMRRFTSGILAAAMVASLVSVAPKVTVEAEEFQTIAGYTWQNTELIKDYSFEDNDGSWTLTGGFEITDERAETGSYALGAKWNDASEQEAKATQKVTLTPGWYYLSFKQDGENMDSGLKVSIGNATTGDETLKTSGWNDGFKTVKTDEFYVEEENDYTITVEGTIPAKYWGRLDDFVLYKYAKVETTEFKEVFGYEWTTTELIKNGTFENGSNEWTCTPSITVKASDSNNTNTTNVWNLWQSDTSATEISVAQTITLDKGYYRLGLQHTGAKDVKNGLTVKIGNYDSIELKDDTGWGTWVTEEGKIFEVTTDDTEVSVSITGTLAVKAWGEIDDIVLYNYAEIEDYDWEATELITNGKFESESEGWTCTPSITVKASDSNNTNTTNVWNLWQSDISATEISVAQTITLDKGYYRLGLQHTGAKDVKNGLTVKIGDYDSIELKDDTGWGTWVTEEGKIFEVTTDDTEVSISITGTLAAKAWGEIDNIVLYKWTELVQANAELKALIEVSKKYIIDSCTSESVDNFKEKLAAAQTVVDKGSEATKTEISTAYDALVAAIEGLAKDVSRVSDYVSEIDYGGDDVIIMPVENIKEDTIRGIDVSSYISLMDAFDYLNEQAKSDGKEANYGFKDKEGKLLTRQGFFNYLASQGVNYIRVRVWNDPYNSVMTDKGYGGGDNDVDKAIEIGEYATKAGMKLLVDFHFSDSWTDPGKQREPKEWRGYTVDQKATAIADFTKETLTEMKTQKINIGMVQIGNETNGKFCGEDSWTNMNKLFDAGCDAVHEVDSEIKAVLHFTDVQESGKQTGYAKSLSDYDGDGDGTKEGVSYDVFATSYYPYWHGSLENLTNVLDTIATTYNKEVMVAETSYANTMVDTDGHSNTVRVGTNDTGSNLLWDMNVQGQASEVRAVIEAVTKVSNDKGLGVIYWEGAWITLQNTNVESESEYTGLVKYNRSLWEKFGAGWASSAASEYGKDEAEFYGGSAVDNQAFFDADGNPLPSIKAFNYKYLKDGYGDTSLVVTGYDELSYTLEVGNTLEASELPKGQATYSNAEKVKFDIDWNESDIAKINEKAVSDANAGDYSVSGTAVVNGKNITQTCTVTIAPKNQLKNGDFQKYGTNTWTDWETSGTGCNTNDMGTNSRNDSGGSVHYYNSSKFEFNVYQNVDVTDVTEFIPGTYEAYCYFEGADSNVDISVTVGDKTYTAEPVKSGGWSTWLKVAIKDIDISYETIKNIDSIKYNIHCIGEGGAYGGIDDAHLCMTEVDPAYTQAIKDAEVVDKLIEDIGEVNVSSEAAISEAEEKYNALSELAKKLVTKLDDLNSAKADIVLVKEADAVDKKITAIGTITSLEQKTAVEEARKAYAELSADAKAKVKNEAALKAAEDEIAKLEKAKADAENAAKEAAEAAAKAEQAKAAAAADADMYINAIGTVTTLNSKATVDYARKVYDALTDEQKALVKNYDKLVAAEKAIEELVFEATPAAQDEKITEVTTNAQYKVTKVPEYDGAVGTVTYTAPADNTAKTVTIPATITYHGVKYKVTAIADNTFKGNKKIQSVTIGANISKIGKKAFYNCKNLKKITIKTSKLTTSMVGANAFKNIKKTATIKVPAKKLKAYKKLLKKKGVTSKAKIKK